MACTPSTSNECMSDDFNRSLADLINLMERFTDYKLYKDRLKTFINVLTSRYIDGERMSRAGLYFIGPYNRVQCAYCLKRFVGWVVDNPDPDDFHKELSPNCEYYTNPECIPIQDRVFFYLQTVGIIPRLMVHERNQMFITVESRLKTFDTLYIKLSVNLITLCEAGFFYEGPSDKDRVKCFCCELILNISEMNFDAWKIHALGKPDCLFLLLTKGKDFVRQTLGRYHPIPKISHDYFIKLLTYQVSEEDGAVYPLVIRKIKNMDRLRDLKPRSQLQENSGPDSLLCKICFKEKLEVLSISCGHVFACIQCVVAVPDCAVCRHLFTVLIRIYLDFDRVVEKKSPLKHPFTSAAVRIDGAFNPVLCQVCQKLPVQVAIAPCRHAYACFECAIDSKICLICSTKAFAFIYLYL